MPLFLGETLISDVVISAGGIPYVYQDSNGYVVIGKNGPSPTPILNSILDRSFSGVYSNHELTAIGSYAFYGCSGLVEVDLPNVETINSSGLSSTGLTKVFLPKFRKALNNHPFSYNTSLVTIVLPAVNMTSSPNYFCTNCTALTTIDVGALDDTGTIYFSGNSFSSCSSLNKLIFRKTTGIATIGTATMSGTPFADGGSGGTIYVPSALKSTYESNTNWSAVLARTNNSITTIEGSQYENYYADGTPIPSAT